MALISPEDVQNLVEERLKNVAPMRDHRTDLYRLMYGWWTQKYWTGTAWVAFMQRALFVFGRDERLVNNPEMLHLLLHTIRAIHRVYYFTKVAPAVYSTAFLAEVTEMVCAALTGIYKMQQILEYGGRKDVCKYEWGYGIHTAKAHGAGGMAESMLDKGSVEGCSTGLYEATNTPVKFAAKRTDGRKATSIEPTEVLRTLYTRDVREAKVESAKLAASLGVAQETALAGPVVEGSTSMGRSALSAAARKVAHLPYNNPTTRDEQLAQLGFDPAEISVTFMMSERVGDNGQRLKKRNKL